MIVIADTSPICYLILIGQTDLLPRLYGKVIIPVVVRDELAATASPKVIRDWMSQTPAWLGHS
jgi:predicted nucleic acid-binding protein